MVTINPRRSRVEGNRLILVLESPTLSELLNNQIGKMATDSAYQFGWAGACLNGMSPPMPVSADGETPESYKELAKLANQEGTYYYREVYLVQPFGR